MFLIEKFRDGLAVACFWILAAQQWPGHRLLFYSNSFGEGLTIVLGYSLPEVKGKP